MARGKPFHQTIYLREAMGDSYFQWLADDKSLHGNNEYWRLLRALHRKEFYATVSRDRQIADDGLYLRYIYRRNYRSYDAELPILPSCLEALIGLAMRLHVGLMRIEEEEWFWIFLTNLGLDKFTDDEYDQMGGTDAVNAILSRWLMRQRKNDGTKYTIFPCKNADFGYKDLDLVAQAYHYIRETFNMADDTVTFDPQYYNDRY